jgi:hypothetical protein
LIKRCRVRSIYPGILERHETGSIEDDLWEFAPLEEGFIEPHVEECVQASINIDAQEIFRPFEDIGAEV